MSDGSAALSEMIEKLKKIGGDRMPERVSELAAPLVEEVVKASASAGSTPMGQGWAPKKGGGRALVNAAAAIAVRARGRIVEVLLSGPTVFHHKGLGGAVRRQVIPDAVTVPPALWDAMQRAAKRAWDEVMSR